MRIYLYVLAGLTFAITGWNLGTFLLVELNLRNLINAPEAILIPSVTATLAAGLILTEILLSNPTRIRQSLNLSRQPLAFALGLGLSLGVVAGFLILLVRNPNVSTFLKLSPEWIRWCGWFLVGLSVTGAETLAWFLRCQEAHNQKRFVQRLGTSFGATFLASYFAARLFEAFKASGALEAIPTFDLYQECLGLGLFGALLGLALGLSTSPSYLCALRAGAGFEFYGAGVNRGNTIQGSVVSFVGSEALGTVIEEGLSIQLPSRGRVKIGSDGSADIKLKGLAPQVATLKLSQRDVYLFPDETQCHNIHINGSPCSDYNPIRLRHNTILSFYPPQTDAVSPDRFYRFVYYNRFLDPQA